MPNFDKYNGHHFPRVGVIRGFCFTITVMLVGNLYAFGMPPSDQSFLSIGVGGQKYDLPDSVPIHNGSGFPSPGNIDLYFTNARASVVMSIAYGYLWQLEETLISKSWVGIKYAHIFKTNLGDISREYSLQAYENYHFRQTLQSDALLVSAKLNAGTSKISPYVEGGVGIVHHRVGQFTESPLPGILHRLSPAFSAHDQTNFSAEAGIGLDISINEHWIASIGYLYQSLGKVRSGTSISSWGRQVLNYDNIHSNQGMVKVNYLMNA